eukprot:14219720-Alexandrium_andersonii.AAC.1
MTSLKSHLDGVLGVGLDAQDGNATHHLWCVQEHSTESVAMEGLTRRAAKYHHKLIATPCSASGARASGGVACIGQERVHLT